MARTRIEKILKAPNWAELRESFSRRSQIRFPIQAERVFSKGFGGMFKQDIPWFRPDLKRQFPRSQGCPC